jgi:L-malate glycosyltransferase
MRCESENIEMQKHILHVFSAFRIGGTESRTCQIINHFGNRYRHTICSLENNFEAKSLLQKSGNVAFVQIRSKRYNLIENVRRYRRFLKTLKPDILITHAWGTMEWTIANSFAKVCPNIHALEGFGSDEIDKQKIRRRLTRMAVLPTCSRVVVCSERLLELAVTDWRLPTEKVLFIPNGIDYELFRGGVRKRLRRKAGEKAVLGVVGSLTSLKNHLRLLRVLKSLRHDIDFELVVAGDGPERIQLEHFVSSSTRLKKRVKFVGHCAEPWKILEKLHIFCVSSDTEQMPMAVLEAMAAGLPVISTDAGDVKLMVSDPNRPFVVRKEDEKTYADKLSELILSPELCETLGERNSEKCNRLFRNDSMYRKYEALYGSV